MIRNQQQQQSHQQYQYQQSHQSNHNNNMGGNNKPAAHTFCKKCGVHILRVPDPNSNALEVNTNCLDGGSSLYLKKKKNHNNISSSTQQRRRAIQYEFNDSAIEVVPTTITPTPTTNPRIPTNIVPVKEHQKQQNQQQDYVDSSWTIDTLQGSSVTHSRGEEDSRSSAISPFHHNHHDGGGGYQVSKKLHLTSTSSQQNTATTETPSSFASSIHRLDSALSSASESSSCGGLSFDDGDALYDKTPPRELSLERRGAAAVVRSSTPGGGRVEGGGVPVWSNSASRARGPVSSSRSNRSRNYFQTDTNNAGGGGTSSGEEPYKSPLVMRDQLKYYMTKHLKSSQGK